MTIETLAHQGVQHTTLAGIDTERLKAMRNASLRASFSRLDETPYRMEFVARIYGREYVNDAASRTANATWYTLERMQGGIVWIACDGEGDYGRLLPLAKRKVRELIVLGEGGNLANTFADVVPSIKNCRTMAEAVREAYCYEADDVKVLFSPSCFDDTPTAELGESFRKVVNEL